MKAPRSQRAKRIIRILGPREVLRRCRNAAKGSGRWKVTKEELQTS